MTPLCQSKSLRPPFGFDLLVNPPTAHSTPVTDFTSKKIPCTLSIPHNKEYEIVKKKQKTSARNSLFTTYHPQTTPPFYDLHVNFTIYRPPQPSSSIPSEIPSRNFTWSITHIFHTLYPVISHIPYPRIPSTSISPTLRLSFLPYHLPSFVHIHIPTSLHPRIRLP